MSRKAKTTAASEFAAALLGCTMLAGLPGPVMAQETDAPVAPTVPVPAIAPAEQGDVISSIVVVGAQRLEPQTILSYISLRPGEVYTAAAADQALKELAATELFADYQISNNNGVVTIEVTENPVVNRIVLEGNRKLKDDKILPEIRLAPRQIFTRSKVRADAARIIELYKRQGRFAATVEPQMVRLDQNRVDVVFEISEGPKSKVRQINIIGNEAFSDDELEGEMVTQEAGPLKFFSSATSYDPDRLAFDQQKLRLFYLTQGYADFRVVSAVAELTPDNRDFIITYVVEEGPRYRFGDVSVESQLRDFDSEALTRALPMEEGDWYNAKLVEDTVEQLTRVAGAAGYAFADVRPQFTRNREDLTMDVEFVLNEAARVYVERIDIQGNTLTQDKVIRREFRLAEGDAFNSLALRRSTNRIKSLGYFQQNFEITQVPGSAPDRVILEANVQEQPTGQLSLSAGFSSLESFILQGSIQQRNFRGRGQTVGASVNYSRYSQSARVSFTEPYLFDNNVSVGVDLYVQDYNNGYFNRDTATYEQSTIGGQLRVGVPLTEYMSLLGRYTLNYDEVSLDERQFFADFDEDGIQECEPLLAGRYLCDAVGDRVSSILGVSAIYSTLDSNIRPTSGTRATASVDYAGLGGSVEYLRARLIAAKYWNLGSGFIFSLAGEAGHIKALGEEDDVLLTDRFFLGSPQIRGFDIRGIGPRVIRQFYEREPDGGYVTDADGDFVLLPLDHERNTDDALGGDTYYLARAELEIPVSSGIRELGLRPSIFADMGAVFGLTDPELDPLPPPGIRLPLLNENGEPLYRQDGAENPVTSSQAPDGSANTPLFRREIPAFREVYLGDTASPRLSIGVGVNWNSPFGPFRLDVAYPILKEEGDDTKIVSFNVGTQF